MARIIVSVCLIVCSGGILSAAGPTIGIAMANGSFLLDRSPVAGNANIFEGSVIETGKAMSDLTLANGLKIRLGMESRGRVFQDRLVLEQGAGQVTGSNYRVEAGRLRVASGSLNATARVAFGNKNLVEVAAISGALRVVTAEGVPVANMTAGSALGFTDQAGASTPTILHGKVVRSNGKLMLTDTTTKVTVELRGSGLDQYVGKSIAVTGNMVSTDVLQVLSVDVSAGAVAGAAGGGLSHAAIAGIAIAGATGLGLGLAASQGAFSGSNASQ